MFKLVICDDESRTTVVPLVRDEISIGRKEGNTIRLTERNVSRRHAKLLRENGAYLVEDVNSYNGIRVNGVRVKGRALLKHGDEVMIGDYKLSLLLDGAEAAAGEATIPMEMPPDAATAMISAPREPATPARLVMISPPSPGAEFALSRGRMRLGRAEDLDVSVNHRSVSREHAEIVREGESFKITDLGSANGLRVNGQEITQSELRPGDVVELGQVRFRYVGQGEHYRFDADQTIQMDAVRVDERSRAPLVVGVLLILVAIVLATLLALAGEERSPRPPSSSDPFASPTGPEGPDQPPLAPEDPSVTPTPPPPNPPPAPEQLDVAQVLQNADALLEARRWEDAAAQYARVLAQEESNTAARHGKAQAESEARAQQAYLRGRAIFEDAQLREDDRLRQAAEAFADIPNDSYYRTQTEVTVAVRRQFERVLSLARGAVSSNPGRAASLIRPFVNDRALLEAQQARAASLLREANRGRQEPPPSSTPEPPSRPNPPPTPPPTPPPAAGPDRSEQIRGCRGDSQCYVRVIGRAQNARELGLLIESHRNLGHGAESQRLMRQFIQSYPNHPRAAAYRQVILRGQ